jgi:hypothetical protein
MILSNGNILGRSRVMAIGFGEIQKIRGNQGETLQSHIEKK